MPSKITTSTTQIPPTAADIICLENAEEVLRRLGDPAAAATVRQARVGLEKHLSPEQTEIAEQQRKIVYDELCHRQKVSIYSGQNALSPAQHAMLGLLGQHVGGCYSFKALGKNARSAKWLVEHDLADEVSTSNGPGVKLSKAGREVYRNRYAG